MSLFETREHELQQEGHFSQMLSAFLYSSLLHVPGVVVVHEVPSKSDPGVTEEQVNEGPAPSRAQP